MNLLVCWIRLLSQSFSPSLHVSVLFNEKSRLGSFYCFFTFSFTFLFSCGFLSSHVFLEENLHPCVSLSLSQMMLMTSKGWRNLFLSLDRSFGSFSLMTSSLRSFFSLKGSHFPNFFTSVMHERVLCHERKKASFDSLQ